MDSYTFDIVIEKLNFSQFFKFIKDIVLEDNQVQLNVSLNVNGKKIGDLQHQIRINYQVYSDTIPMSLDSVFLIDLELKNNQEIDYKQFIKKPDIVEELDEYMEYIRSLVKGNLPLFSDLFKRGNDDRSSI